MSEESASPTTAYDELRAELREIEVLASAAAVLGWDQETMMPVRAAPLRAEQAAMLSQLVHRRHTSARFADLLAMAEDELSTEADPAEVANLREIRRSFDRAVRMPESLVREFAETTTLAQVEWRAAREESDFERFAPWLEKILRLTRARSECLMTEEMTDAYDPLLDEYEPGVRTEAIETEFSELRRRLAPLIAELRENGTPPDDRVHRIELPIDRQDAISRRVMERVGFDFDAGRLDVSTHPFCTGIGPGDTRLTTRYRPDGLFDALSSTLHETGHGLYEQRLPKADRMGEPLAEAVSLGIHESQSRLWENFVGRSRPFWVWALPELKREFGEPLNDVDLDEVYGAMNIVRPNLIRVESDEATYNLHIMLRFDLERALLTGNLDVADLPGAWNERIRDDLGLEVPDDRRGCLQDVHWSMGAIGYFPTYTLGNLYAAQFWRALRDQIQDLDEQISKGEFHELLEWLTREIHQHGRRYTAPQLCMRVTGSPLSSDALMEYLEGKLRSVYRL